MSIEERVIKNSVLGVNLRIFLKNGEPHFLGKEVANRLEFKNSRDVLSGIKERHKMSLREFCKDISEEKKSEIFSKLSPLSTIIDEPAFYCLCLKSSSSKVDEFQEWVCEILVKIRKKIEPNFKSLSLKDSPVEMLREEINSKIPEYSPNGDNSLRVQIHKELEKGAHISKDPVAQKTGEKGEKQTWINVRKMETTLRDVQKNMEESLESINKTLKK